MNSDQLKELQDAMHKCIDLNCLPDEIENYLLDRQYFDKSGEELEVLPEDFDWKLSLSISYNPWITKI